MTANDLQEEFNDLCQSGQLVNAGETGCPFPRGSFVGTLGSGVVPGQAAFFFSDFPTQYKANMIATKGIRANQSAVAK